LTIFKEWTKLFAASTILIINVSRSVLGPCSENWIRPRNNEHKKPDSRPNRKGKRGSKRNERKRCSSRCSRRKLGV
jgi:hypothetical protein